VYQRDDGRETPLGTNGEPRYTEGVGTDGREEDRKGFTSPDEGSPPSFGETCGRGSAEAGLVHRGRFGGARRPEAREMTVDPELDLREPTCDGYR